MDGHGGLHAKKYPTTVQGRKCRGETMMKKLLAMLIATAFVCAFAPLAGASETAIINVTLNPQATIAIACNRSTWEPTVGIGANGSTAEDWGNLTNVGNVAVNVNVSVSTAGMVWTLAGSSGHDRFAMKTLGVALTLTTGQQVFDANLAPPGDGGHAFTTFGLCVEMPTTSSTGLAQHPVITFTATAL